jgi:hypothetical protein
MRIPRRTAAAVTVAAVAALALPAPASARPAAVHARVAACRAATVPQVAGQPEHRAVRAIIGAGYGSPTVSIQKSGYTPVVVTQIPAAGTAASTCTQVRIILGDAPARRPAVKPGTWR